MSLRRATHPGELLAGLADGSLPDAHRERALGHLAHCCACRAEVEALRSLRLRLLGLGEEVLAPPVGLADRLMALSSGQLPTHDVGRVPTLADGRREAHWRRRAMLPAAGAAGAVVAVGAAAVLLASSSTTSRDRPVPRPRVDPATGLVQVSFPGPPATPLPQPVGAVPR